MEFEINENLCPYTACLAMMLSITVCFFWFLIIELKLTPVNQLHLEYELLATVQTETQVGMRRKICEVVSELARQLLDEEGINIWPDFLLFLFESASNGTLEIKESAL